jgi:hypothetical protein
VADALASLERAVAEGAKHLAAEDTENTEEGRK